MAWRAVVRGRKDARLIGEWNVLVDRRHLDRLYPDLATAKTLKTPERTPDVPRNRGGRPREYDYEGLLREALIYAAVYGWPDSLSGEGGLFSKLAGTKIKLPGPTTLHDIFGSIDERIKAEQAVRNARMKPLKKPAR
jgi:hypothetical protein